ncbi:MAG: hypothetical protein ACSHWY_08455 [Octadecabacter sp.]
MEEDFEELDDIIEAHTTVLFIREQNLESQVGTDILTYIGLPPHVVDVSAQPDLERMVIANSADVGLPAIFINGIFFSNVFFLMDAISLNQLKTFLDNIDAPYDPVALAEITAANQ